MLSRRFNFMGFKNNSWWKSMSTNKLIQIRKYSLISKAIYDSYNGSKIMGFLTCNLKKEASFSEKIRPDTLASLI